MLKITITEVNTNEDINAEGDDDIEQRAEAIALVEKSQEILDNLLRLGIFENDLSVENRLTDIATMLFTVQCNLTNSMEYAE